MTATRGVLAVLVVLALAPATRADSPSVRAGTVDDEIARAHFNTGMACYRAERFAPAVREFIAAYRLSRRSDFLYNIGLAYEKADDPGHATAYFRRYFSARPEAPERREVEARLLLLARRVATLVLRSSQQGVEVRVDGEVIGLTPIDPQLLTQGRHGIEARQPDGLVLGAEIDLRGGRSSEVALDRLGAAAAAPPRAERDDHPAAERAAANEEIARAYFTTGSLYYRNDRFEPAVRQFVAAWRLSRRVDLLYNIAHAYDKLDDAGRAIIYFQAFLHARPEAPERREIEAEIAGLMPHAATLRVITGVPDAEVWIDGVLSEAASGEPLLVTAGRHRIEASLVGDISAASEIVLKGGESRVLTLHPHPSLPLAALPDSQIIEKSKQQPKWLVPVMIGGAVVIAAAVVVGLVLGLAGADYSANTRALCPNMTTGCVLFDGTGH